MSNSVRITDQTSAVLVPTGMTGNVTDIYVTAGASATAVALYDGTNTSAPLLFMDKVAAGASSPVTNCKIRFNATGLYALVDANTESLILHGDWAKTLPASVLSGG